LAAEPFVDVGFRIEPRGTAMSEPVRRWLFAGPRIRKKAASQSGTFLRRSVHRRF
jgi:hypothetical protein